MNIAKDLLLGVSIGDALGVPVEFKSREELRQNPVKDMIGYGTYNQPPGTWSDDSSLTFCLASSLVNGYDLKDIAIRFTKWFYQALWTPHGKVFDIGMHTKDSIMELNYLIKNGQDERLRELYTDNEMANGNGGLMRISPLIFLTRGLGINKKFELIREVCALTHGHIRTAIACLIYLLIAEYIIEGDNKKSAYLRAKNDVRAFLNRKEIAKKEIEIFVRILDLNIGEFEEEDIKSSGYVIHSLEASLWCLLRYDNYEETVLKAVNLGHDTDTTAAIVGGLAGLLYTTEAIPERWINQLAKKEKIIELAEKLERKYAR